LFNFKGLYAQNNTNSFNRFELNVALIIKKNIPYTENLIENVNGKYKLTTSLSSQLDILISYQPKDKIKLYSGVLIANNSYSYDFKYGDARNYFNSNFEVGVTSYKIPIRLGYQINKYFELISGVSLNFNEYDSYSYSNSFGGYSGDTSTFKYSASTGDFRGFITVSGNLGLQFNTKGKFKVFLISDIDFGNYLQSSLYNEINLTSNKEIYTAISNARFLYLSIGMSYRIFKIK
jgi:hypothetical protein